MIWVDNLNPVIFSFGPIALHWYGAMYALGFLLGYVWLKKQIKNNLLQLTESELEWLFTAMFLGVVLGGRIGHFVFYDGARLLTDPLALFRIWDGGMSFHGGFLGVLLTIGIFARRTGKKFLMITDAIAVPVALGLAFGRLGNFINGELWGRPTSGSWGVIFPRAGNATLRHPAQLYAAVKDLFIFTVLNLAWGRQLKTGTISSLFLLLYGILRTSLELFWRAPLDGFLFGIPVGAVYSLPLILLGIVGLIWIYRKG